MMEGKTMKVKDILDKLLKTDYKIVDHWSGVEYPYITEEIENRRIERLLVEENKLIISI
jgi:hypothetical protein